MFECYDVTNKWLFFVGMPILMVCSEHPTLTALHCSKVLFLQCCHIKGYNKIFTKNWGVHSLLWDTQGLICGSGSGTSFCRIPLLMRQWKTFLLTCSVHIWKILYNDCVCGTSTFEIKNLSATCELLCSHNIMHGSNSLYRVFFLNCSLFFLNCSLSLEIALERASRPTDWLKKTCKWYIFVTMQQWPD